MDVLFSFLLLVCFNTLTSVTSSKISAAFVANKFLENVKKGNSSVLSQYFELKIDGSTMSKGLVLAIENNHLSIVEILLSETNLVVPHDALFVAVSLKNDAIIEKLLSDPRIDVNFENASKESPIHLLKRGSKNLFFKLLKNPRLNVNKLNGSGQTVLHLAAIEEDSEYVSKILKRPEVDVNLKDGYGNTALYYAFVNDRHTNFLKLLKDPMIETTDLFNEFEDSILKTYVVMGRVELVKKLVEINPAWRYFGDEKKPAIQIAKSIRLRNTLFDAIFRGNVEVLKKLIADGVDCNMKHYDGTSPIEATVSSGQLDCLNLLLQQEAIIIPEDSMVNAVYHNETAIFSRLLEDGRVDVNYGNRADGTALSAAIESNYIKIAEKLIKDPRIELNNPECSALHMAIDRDSSVEIFTLLIQSGKIDINLRDHKGHTALFYAVSKGKEQLALELLKVPGIDVNLEKDLRESALHVALQNGYLSVVRALIEAKADLNLTDIDGRTAEDCAFQSQSEETITLISEIKGLMFY